MHTLFILADLAGETPHDRDIDRIADLVAGLQGLTAGLVLTPSAPGGAHPFSADGAGPGLVLQLDFAQAKARDDAMSLGSLLAGLPEATRALAGARIRHQPMTGRDFPVAGPAGAVAPCTFLVEYAGEADDLPAWLDHYDAHHPPIMVRFPGIRAVATFRPLESWTSELPFGRDTAMQRNKVVFDSVDALVAALASTVMDEMRADTAGFPSFSRRATHHAMDTADGRAARLTERILQEPATPVLMLRWPAKPALEARTRTWIRRHAGRLCVLRVPALRGASG